LNIVQNKKQNAQDPLRNEGILKPLPGLHGPNSQNTTDENIAILWYLPISWSPGNDEVMWKLN
jgi:hypothetical protein